MIENRLLAGAIAGIPISLLCLGYALVRTETIVTVFAGSGPEPLAAGTARFLAFGAAVVVGPALGILAGLVLGWLPSDAAYVALAFGLATLLSVVALATGTPLAGEKVVLNYMVALSLGLLLPRLAAG